MGPLPHGRGHCRRGYPARAAGARRAGPVDPHLHHLPARRSAARVCTLVRRVARGVAGSDRRRAAVGGAAAGNLCGPLELASAASHEVLPAREAHRVCGRVHRCGDGKGLYRAAAARPACRFPRCTAAHAPRLCPLCRGGPDVDHHPVRHGRRLPQADARYLPRPGSGAYCGAAHQGRVCVWRLDRAAKLPPRKVVDAEAREDCRVLLGQRLDPPKLPPLAHIDAGKVLSGAGAAGVGQDDLRAAKGAARQPQGHVGHRDRQAVGRLQQAARVAQAALRGRLLPRRCAGAAQVRAAWLEHPLRVQRYRPRDVDGDVANVPRRAGGDSVGRATLRDWPDQLRRPRHRRLGPAQPDGGPPPLLPARGARGRLPLRAGGHARRLDVLLDRRGRPTGRARLGGRPTLRRPGDGLWAAPERQDHLRAARDGQAARNGDGDPAAPRRRR
mmetsp:Transcript_10265/g.33997  ORF Transcript_10265/g.33997 Transcript_10265/m.33997 type:complete len:443 (-) Transcript_10265:970-2298(-)